MLQFFEWLWRTIGMSAAYRTALESAGAQLEQEVSFQGFLKYWQVLLAVDGHPSGALWVFLGGILLLIVASYLLGSLNGAIIVSRYVFHDDIREHGSGNAGLTNMGRVFGKKGVWPTLAIDVAKQFLSVVLGIVLLGETGAYLAGLFCMVGHIAPIFFRFKGGKGVLTAGVMILLIDYQVFLIDFALFAVIVLISRYVSLGSVIAGFALPGIVYASARIRGTVPSFFALFFAVLIGLMLILMHRENIRRLYQGKENKLNLFGKKKGKKKKKETADADPGGDGGSAEE